MPNVITPLASAVIMMMAATLFPIATSKAQGLNAAEPFLIDGVETEREASGQISRFCDQAPHKETCLKFNTEARQKIITAWGSGRTDAEMRNKIRSLVAAFRTPSGVDWQNVFYEYSKHLIKLGVIQPSVYIDRRPNYTVETDCSTIYFGKVDKKNYAGTSHVKCSTTVK